MTEDSQNNASESEESSKGPDRLERSDLELLGWLIAGFVISVALKVTVVSASIIVAIVVLSILRMSYEAADRNPRPSTWMSPMFILGWGFGLFVRALVS